MLKTLALGAACVAVAFAGGASAQDMKATHAFLMKAAASDKYEIEAAQIAQTRATSPAVKRFAAMMITDHTASSAKLKAAGETSMGHPMMAAMTMPDQEKMLTALRTAEARAFDRTYMDQQEQAHAAALELMKDYAAKGDYPAIRAAAAEIAPAVQKHLDLARSIRTHLK